MTLDAEEATSARKAPVPAAGTGAFSEQLNDSGQLVAGADAPALRLGSDSGRGLHVHLEAEVVAEDGSLSGCVGRVLHEKIEVRESAGDEIGAAGGESRNSQAIEERNDLPGFVVG